MNRKVFYILGAIYFLVGFFSSGFFSLYIEMSWFFGFYAFLALFGLFLTIKHRTMNPVFLLIISVLIMIYTWFSWTDHTAWYQPDGMHSLAGIILIGYGVFFFDKFQNNT
jgi:hypothetical protein